MLNGKTTTKKLEDVKKGKKALADNSSIIKYIRLQSLLKDIGRY